VDWVGLLHTTSQRRSNNAISNMRLQCSCRRRWFLYLLPPRFHEGARHLSSKTSTPDNVAETATEAASNPKQLWFFTNLPRRVADRLQRNFHCALRKKKEKTNQIMILLIQITLIDQMNVKLDLWLFLKGVLFFPSVIF
jgi:hypothetical protein